MALLALAVVLCGGAAGDATAAAAVLHHSQERVSQTQRDDELATLLSCLEEAAKELRKLDGQVATLPVKLSVQPPTRTARLPRPVVSTVHASRPTLHTLIDLPPPAAA